jgi:hypothetical protein
MRRAAGQKHFQTVRAWMHHLQGQSGCHDEKVRKRLCRLRRGEVRTNEVTLISGRPPLRKLLKYRSLQRRAQRWRVEAHSLLPAVSLPLIRVRVMVKTSLVKRHRCAQGDAVCTPVSWYSV